MFTLLSDKTILRLSSLFKTFSPTTSHITEILQNYKSDTGLLARSVTDAEAEEMLFSPRVYKLSPPNRLMCLSILTKIEDERRHSQSLLTRYSCSPTIHFYNDKIKIENIHHQDIDLSSANPPKLHAEFVLAERRKLVLHIRNNKGDIPVWGKNWLTGDIGATVNEVRAHVNPLQKIGFGILLNKEEDFPTALFANTPPLTELFGNTLMDKTSVLKAVLDMLYSGIEHAKNYGEQRPYFVYTKGFLFHYHPTPQDIIIFLQAANDILKNPAFYKVFNDDRNTYSGCARVFLKSVEAIKKAGEHSLKTTSWRFGLFGRMFYSIGKNILGSDNPGYDQNFCR
jgi:hypothetical protein